MVGHKFWRAKRGTPEVGFFLDTAPKQGTLKTTNNHTHTHFLAEFWSTRVLGRKPTGTLFPLSPVPT